MAQFTVVSTEKQRKALLEWFCYCGTLEQYRAAPKIPPVAIATRSEDTLGCDGCGKVSTIYPRQRSVTKGPRIDPGHTRPDHMSQL